MILNCIFVVAVSRAFLTTVCVCMCTYVLSLNRFEYQMKKIFPVDRQYRRKTDAWTHQHKLHSVGQQNCVVLINSMYFYRWTYKHVRAHCILIGLASGSHKRESSLYYTFFPISLESPYHTHTLIHSYTHIHMHTFSYYLIYMQKKTLFIRRSLPLSPNSFALGSIITSAYRTL